MQSLSQSIRLLFLLLWTGALLALPAQAQTAEEINQANIRTVQLHRSGEYDAALANAKTTLEAADQALGPQHPHTLTSVNNLAVLYLATGRYGEAEPLLRRALEAQTRTLGPEHPYTLTSVNNLAGLFYSTGRYSEAEVLYQQVLEARERTLGPEHPDTLISVSLLAQLYSATGRRYGLAAALYQGALEAQTRTLGPEHPDTLRSVNNLALVYKDTGRYSEAEPLLQRALEARERTLGPEHPDALLSISHLAQLYSATGRYGEAEPLLQRALEAWERTLGPEHPDTLQSVNNLAGLYHATGRYDEAEPLYQRALEARERTLGPEHPYTLGSVDSLAGLYHATGRYDEAEPLYQRALEARERTLSPEHPSTLTSVNNLAELYKDTGRYREAEPLLQRALEARERTLGPEHPDTLTSVNSLAGLYYSTGPLGEAEVLFQRVLEASERTLGPEHPHTLTSVKNLASLYDALDRPEAAERTQRRAIKALDAKVRRTGQVPLHEKEITRAGVNGDFELLLLSQLGAEASPDALAAGLLGAQFGRAEAAGRALNAAAARLAADDPAIGEKVRALDALNTQLAQLQAARTQAFASGDNVAAGELGKQTTAIEAEASTKAEAIAAAFPDYASLAAARFVTADELQGDDGLLGQGEALIVFVAAEKIGAIAPAWFALVATADTITVTQLPANPETVSAQIASLRASVTVRQDEPTPAFDLASATALHQSLFAPLSDQLKGVDHLLVVPDGPLMSLPLELLVAQPPPEDGTGADAYRQTTWLGEQYAISVLPAVSSLRALRRIAGDARGEAPLLAFADPTLKAVRADAPDGGALMSLSAADAFETVCDLPDVPATATIARSMARALGAEAEALVQGDQATEAQLRTLNASGALRNARVVAFNTHGLTAAEAGDRLAEPALALTPAGGCGKERPKTLDPANDGFLTVSEVVELKLDADWVLLTACNTAAADGEPGAEPLSGLARGFFYAGARALLVSHWPAQVSSDPTVDGPTEMLMAELFSAKNAALPKAEALKAAQAAVRQTYPHPAHWATFSLVGEGR